MGNKHTRVSMITDAPSGGAAAVMGAADRAAAPARAIDEIRELVWGVRPGAMIPSRQIRQILRRHGV